MTDTGAMSFLSASEAYVYSSSAWLAFQAFNGIVYPQDVFASLAVDEDPSSPADFQTNLLRAGSVVPLILAALILGLNFGAIQPPAKTSATTPNFTAFLSQSAPFLLIIYFSSAAFFTYSRYMWNEKWALFFSTVLNGGFALVGGLGMMFSGESSAGRGSGWLFRTAEERQRRKEARKAKRKEFFKTK